MPLLDANGIRQAQQLAAQLPGIAPAQALRFAASFGNTPNAAAGTGREFWQFRRYQSGDDARAIDWRKSARMDTPYIREQEHDSPDILALLVDYAAPTMAFRGHKSPHSKRTAALIAAMALVSHGLGQHQLVSWQGARARIYASMPALLAVADDTKPHAPSGTIQASRLYWLTDGLHDEETLLRTLRRKRPTCQHAWLVHIIDADEASFPYTGAVRFTGYDGEEPHTTTNALGLRTAYQRAWQAHCQQLQDYARHHGWRYAALHTASSMLETLRRVTA